MDGGSEAILSGFWKRKGETDVEDGKFSNDPTELLVKGVLRELDLPHVN